MGVHVCNKRGLQFKAALTVITNVLFFTVLLFVSLQYSEKIDRSID